MIWYYVVSWWNTSNPVRWISNAVWLQAAILQNCGLHMAIHIWLQSFRIRHPFWRPQNRGRHWSHACSWATKYLWTKKERWFETAIVCKADAALVDHVRPRPFLLHFPLHSRRPQCTFFRAPNARHWTDQGGIEPHRHPIATWYISLKIDHGGHPIQLGKCLKMVRFEATAPRTPYSHFVRKEQLQPSLTAGFRKININYYVQVIYIYINYKLWILWATNLKHCMT